MTRIWKQRSVWALAIGLFAMFSVSDALAQRGRSRSSSGSRRSMLGGSRKSKSRTSKPKSSRAAKPKSKSSWGSKKSTAKSSKGSKADKALYEKAKRNGTAFKTRAEASQAFKKTHAGKYPSKYATKPATRPTHIPQTYSSGGQTYNITYNQQYGGYGYMGAMGTWIMYDAMADAAMMSTLMSNQGYYYGAAPRYGPSFGATTFVVVGCVVLLIVGGAIIASRQGKR